MKVLITAGGTTEPIDNVRSITNTSTGKLGSLIAEAYDRQSEISKIYYICGAKAILPKSSKTEVNYIDTVASVETVLRKIISENAIDIIIHSMAVSDYRVDTVASLSDLTSLINSNLELIVKSGGISNDFFHSAIQNSDKRMEKGGKISSEMNDLILMMVKTPKLISMYHSIAPQAVLVGFKLLDNVSHDDLMHAANRILMDNKCNYVLANDLQDITEDQHVGYLMNEDNSYIRLSTKEEIADAIVAATMNRSAKI